MSVIEILKDLILVEDEDLEIYNLPDQVLYWPDVEIDGDKEPLDLENWEILELNDEKLVMLAGGDWQEPKKLILIPASKHKLMVASVTDIENWGHGLTEDEIIYILQQ